MRAPTKRMQAVAALAELLADGSWRSSADVRQQLAAAGLDSHLAYAAARLLGVERVTRAAGRREAAWRLPPGAPPLDASDVDRRPRPRERPTSTGPARHDAGAICRLCSAPLEGRLKLAVYCGAECKAEAGRLRALVAGEDVGPYRSVAGRLAADPTPGSPLARLLAAAGLARRDGGLA